jgi:hypothetical protein
VYINGAAPAPLFGVGYRFTGLTWDHAGQRFMAISNTTSGFSSIVSITLGGTVNTLFGLGNGFTGGIVATSDANTFQAIATDPTTSTSSMYTINLVAGSATSNFSMGPGFTQEALTSM